MKWLERTIWVTLVAILAVSSAVLWAAWKQTETVWGNQQYLNFMHLLRVQQKLESQSIDAASKSNRDWLSMFWGAFLLQEQHNELLISEDDFERLKEEVAGSQLGIATPEQD